MAVLSSLVGDFFFYRNDSLVLALDLLVVPLGGLVLARPVVLALERHVHLEYPLGVHAELVAGKAGEAKGSGLFLAVVELGLEVVAHDLCGGIMTPVSALVEVGSAVGEGVVFGYSAPLLSLRFQPVPGAVYFLIEALSFLFEVLHFQPNCVTYAVS